MFITIWYNLIKEKQNIYKIILSLLRCLNPRRGRQNGEVGARVIRKSDAVAQL